MRNMLRQQVSLIAMALFAVMSLATVAFAQVHGPAGHPIATPRPIVLSPAPRAVVPPRVVPVLNGGHFTGALPGTKVPLSMLPPLPLRTSANSFRPRDMGHRRILSADGGTINVAAGGGCGGTVGDLFNVGCQVSWQSNGLPNADTKQDFVVLSNNGNESTASATATGGTYGGTAGNTHFLTLNTPGTYIFGTFDTTRGVWLTVVYIDAGSASTIKVFQDAFHTQEQYQFDAASNGNAFILANDLPTTDQYVVYVENESIHPSCIFVAPAAVPAAGAGQLCTPNNSPGQPAPSGSLAVSWPITSATPGGSFAVVLYDKTISQRLGQVQVSVTPAFGLVLTAVPDNAIAAGSTNPSPQPAPIATPSATLAWDDFTEQSTDGVKVTIATTLAHNFLWTLSDPTGTVVSQAAATGGSSLSQLFTFAGNVQSPGDYPSPVFTVNLLDTTQNTIQASQAIKLVGYHTTTAFHTVSDAASLSIVPGASSTAAIIFRNDSDTFFGVNSADSMSGFAITSGNDFTANDATGNGIEMALNGKTLAACTPSCSGTATDSNGNTWTVTDHCSAAAIGPNSECWLEAHPPNGQTSVPPGGTLTVPTLTFFNANGSACGNSCEGFISMLPTHGVQWSDPLPGGSVTAFAPVFFTDGSTTHTALAHIALVGAQTPARNALNGNPPVAPFPETHLYPTRFQQALYDQPTPYNTTQAYIDAYGLTIHNTGTSSITSVALEMPGPFAANNTLINFQIDGRSAGNWNLVIPCPGGNVSAAFSCFVARGGHRINAGGTETIFFDANSIPTSVPYQDLIVESAAPFQFFISPDNPAVQVPVGPVPGFTVDSLALSLYSLDSSLMSTALNPSSVGAGSTPSENIVITNTTTAADPAPEPVDLVIVNVPSANVSGVPTANTPGWSLIGTQTVGATKEFWFGLCAAQFVVADGPPAATPNTNVQPGVPTCTVAQEQNSSLQPGGSLSVNMNLQNLVAGTPVNFTMFAHGADVNGWSSPRAFALDVTSTSASAGFSTINGSAVPVNTEPSIGGSPNTYVYQIKNTSSAGNNLTSMSISIPSKDVNGNNATDTQGVTWTLQGAPTLSGNVDGCAITGTQNANTSGAPNGFINIGGAGCRLLPGDTITVTFTAISPSTQNGEYQFVTTVNPGNNVAGETWLGDTRIRVSLNIGLDLVVGPTNPGPGGSAPSVSCTSCTFAGNTIDFGNVLNNTSQAFGDVVRASVTVVSGSPVNWNLSVQTNVNPANSTGAPTNELLTAVDGGASSPGAGITVDQAAFGVVPTASSLLLANGTSIVGRAKPYDVIQSFKISMGAEPPAPTISTITYTLVAN